MSSFSERCTIVGGIMLTILGNSALITLGLGIHWVFFLFLTVSIPLTLSTFVDAYKDW